MWEKVDVLCRRCVDFQTALYEKNMEKLEYLFPSICIVSKMVSLAEALRSDIESEKELLREKAVEMAYRVGLGAFGDQIIAKFISLGILEDIGNKLGVKISKQSEVLLICGHYLKTTIEQNPLTKDMEESMLKVLININQKPITEEEMDGFLGSLETDKKSLIKIILRNTNLVLYLEDIGLYCAPSMFGTSDKNILSKKLTEFKTAKEYQTVLNIIDTVKGNQGLPSMGPNQNLATEIAKSGFLEPISLDMHGTRINFLFTPEIHDDLYLAKETVAHLRYASTFAPHAYGRLKAPTVFLTKLIEKGEAGNATNIGSDYCSLIANRIIRVEKGGLSGRYTMYPVKKDILEDALSIMDGFKPIEPIYVDKTLLDYAKNPSETRASILNPFNPELKRAYLEVVRMVKNEFR